jgi:hypothetical protein
MTLAGLGYSSALGLAGLLLLAAVAKLLAPREAAQSFEALGVPNAEAVARFVPLPELVAALLLLIVPAVGGVATLMLLAFFSTFVVTRLRAGISAPCACFGAVSAEPISWLTLGRNGAMAVLAIAALATLQPVVPTVGEVLVVLGYIVAVAVLLRIAEGRAATRSR